MTLNPNNYSKIKLSLIEMLYYDIRESRRYFTHINQHDLDVSSAKFLAVKAEEIVGPCPRPKERYSYSAHVDSPKEIIENHLNSIYVKLRYNEYPAAVRQPCMNLLKYIFTRHETFLVESNLRLRMKMFSYCLSDPFYFCKSYYVIDEEGATLIRDYINSRTELLHKVYEHIYTNIEEFIFRNHKDVVDGEHIDGFEPLIREYKRLIECYDIYDKMDRWLEQLFLITDDIDDSKVIEVEDPAYQYNNPREAVEASEKFLKSSEPFIKLFENEPWHNMFLYFDIECIYSELVCIDDDFDEILGIFRKNNTYDAFIAPELLNSELSYIELIHADNVLITEQHKDSQDSRQNIYEKEDYHLRYLGKSYYDEDEEEDYDEY